MTKKTLPCLKCICLPVCKPTIKDETSDPHISDWKIGLCVYMLIDRCSILEDYTREILTHYDEDDKEAYTYNSFNLYKLQEIQSFMLKGRK